jgi:anti-sigma factor RsiW
VTCAETERLLPAYVDNELDDADAARVDEHLAACDRCRGQLARARSLASALQRAPYYTAPDRLRSVVAARAKKPRFNTRPFALAAAALLAVSATAFFAARLTPGARGNSPVSVIATEVVDEHLRALMSGRMYDVASTDQHTVKPWFLGKIDFSPPVVDLAAQGFPLQGGRLDYVGGRKVAALVYTRRQHSITVFVWPSSEPAAPPAASTVRGFHAVHWTRDGMTLWAVSDLNLAELQQFVALQEQAR